MLFNVHQQTNAQRRVKVHVEDPSSNACPPEQGYPALALFHKSARDTIDFGIDFTDWLVANGGSLKSCVYAEGSDSPQSPTIASQAFSPLGETAVMLSGGDVDDAYYIDCTVVVTAPAVSQDNGLALGERTLVRRIHVVVVNG